MLRDTDFYGDEHEVLPSILKCDLTLSKENLVIMGDDLLRIHKAKYSLEPLICKQATQNIGRFFENVPKNSKSKDRFIESLLGSWEDGDSPAFIKEQPVSQNTKIQLLVHMHPRLGSEAVEHPHTGAKK